MRYQRFFEDVLERYVRLRPHDTATRRVPAGSWFGFGAGRSGFCFNWSFATGKRFRAELYVDTGDAIETKALFDELHAGAPDLERAVGYPLTWVRLDTKRGCRLAVYRDVPATPPVEDNEDLKEWAVTAMAKLAEAVRARLTSLLDLAASADSAGE